MDSSNAVSFFSKLFEKSDHFEIQQLFTASATAYLDDPRQKINAPIFVLNLIDIWRKLLPELVFQIKECEISADIVKVRWKVRGIHSGRAYNQKATYREIEFSGRARFAFIGEKINECWGDWGLTNLSAAVCVSLDDLTRHVSCQEIGVRCRIHDHPTGVPLVFFPVMSMPGWMTWRSVLQKTRGIRPSGSLQLISSMRAFLHLPVPEGYRSSTEVEAIRRELHSCGVDEPIDIIGHSAGGTIALEFAISFPNSVRSLVLIEPGPAWVLRKGGALSQAQEEFLQDQLNAFHGEITPDVLSQVYKRSGLYPSDMDLFSSPHWPIHWAYREHLRFRGSLYSPDGDLEKLKTLNVPTLLITGTHANVFYSAIAEALSKFLPQSTLIAMPGGHAPHMGNGEPAFLETIASFYGRLA